jgi:hypothetical protein
MSWEDILGHGRGPFKYTNTEFDWEEALKPWYLPNTDLLANRPSNSLLLYHIRSIGQGK